MRLPRERSDFVTLSGRSWRTPAAEPVRSSCEGSDAASTEVMEEAGERREEVVELVVLLRERPLKTDSRLGLCAWAVDRERVWTECCSGESLFGALV